MKIFGCDPGNTSGYAIVDGEDIIDMGQIIFEDFMVFILKLDWSDIDVIVCEDFRLFRNKAQKQVGSDFQTVQCIGALRLISKQKSIPLIMQMSSILPIAERQAGIKMPKNHEESHEVSALLHVRFYQIRQNLFKSVGQRKAERIAKEIGKVN